MLSKYAKTRVSSLLFSAQIDHCALILAWDLTYRPLQALVNALQSDISAACLLALKLLFKCSITSNTRQLVKYKIPVQGTQLLMDTDGLTILKTSKRIRLQTKLSPLLLNNNMVLLLLRCCKVTSLCDTCMRRRQAQNAFSCYGMIQSIYIQYSYRHSSFLFKPQQLLALLRQARWKLVSHHLASWGRRAMAFPSHLVP